MSDEKQFASAEDLFSIVPDHEDVWLESIGKYIRIRGLTLAEKDAIESESIKWDKKSGKVSEMDPLGNIRSRYIVRSAITENGNRLFSDKDIPRVGQLPAREFDKLFGKVQELSAVSDQDIADILGNSEGGTADEPPTE